MGLFKRATVAGMSHALTRVGIINWPSKQAEEEVVDAIADDFSDEEVPETTDDSGLTEEEAEVILDKIVEVAETLEAQTGGVVDPEINKEAASSDYMDVAAYTAERLMYKAAEETAVATGPEIPGTSTPTPDNSATAEALQDEINVPSDELVVPQGTTAFNSYAGPVGAQVPQNQSPGAVASDPTGEVAKLANYLAALRKQSAAVDGASLSGGSAQGPVPTPRVDLNDNLLIAQAVAAGQGQTAQVVPNSAVVGATMANPAGTPGVTAPISNEPNDEAVKQAVDLLWRTSAGRAHINKLAAQNPQDNLNLALQTALASLRR